METADVNLYPLLVTRDRDIVLTRDFRSSRPHDHSLTDIGVKVFAPPMKRYSLHSGRILLKKATHTHRLIFPYSVKGSGLL
jgi:hypothetical protein